MKTMEITVRGALLTVHYNPENYGINKIYAAECDDILPLLIGYVRIEIYDAVSAQIKLDQINEAYEKDVELRYHQGKMPGDAE